jgi:hypothetical protein
MRYMTLTRRDEGNSIQIERDLVNACHRLPPDAGLFRASLVEVSRLGYVLRRPCLKRLTGLGTLVNRRPAWL